MRSITGKQLQRIALFAVAIAGWFLHAPALAETPNFRLEQIGPAPQFRPTITNVQVVDLDRDRANDVVVCDAQADAVYGYRRSPNGTWQEQQLGEGLVAPAHATVVDLDKDGDNDVLASVMGNLYPDDDVIGSLVLLENREGKFVARTLLDDVRRVVDAQPGDFDGDGDLDIAVAVFGYLRGQVLWLENRGSGFLDHELLSAPGTIHVPVADYDGDGDLDIAAVVSQEEEEVWGFENLGGGKFSPRQLWMTLNYDIGSAGLVQSDLDKDGDVDLLLPVGDNLEDSYSTGQPYHGCLWLENSGGWKFTVHRIATFPGTYAAAAGDLDSDGDEDVVLCSMVNEWDRPEAPSLVWLENDGRQGFTQRTIATDPIMLVTVALGELNGDRQLDVVAGGLHMYPPYKRLGRVSGWVSSDPSQASAPQAALQADQITLVNAKLGPPRPNMERLDAITRADLEALHHKLAAKTIGATTVDDWLELGRAYYAYGFFAAARDCFGAATERDGSSFFANYLRAVSLQRLGDLPAAIEQFQRALPLAEAPHKRWVQHELGRCFLRLEDGERAEAAFVAAGDYPLSLAQLAKLRIRAGRPREAVESLNALARLQPGATEMFLLNARAAAALGDKKMAQEFRDRAEYNSRTLVGDPVAAMVDEVRKKHGAARKVEEARALIQSKNWEQAAATLKPVVEANRSPDAVILLAGAQLQARRPRESIALLEPLLNERSRMPTAMLLLGDAYLAAGNVKKALETWKTTERIRSAAALHERLAAQYAKQGNETAAREEQARRAEAAGIAFLRQANPMRAKEPLQSAVSLNPSLAKAWFYLGECHRVTGDSSAARDAYQRVLKLNPNHGRAAAMLKVLDSIAALN